MRLATFNVENLFRRPVVLDQPTWAEGREQLNDYTKFNGIISKATYSSADKKWLVDFLDRYEMADRRISAEDPSQLNEVRGKLFKLPNNKSKAEIIVNGRGGWDGWLELRRHNVTHVAIENTARAVAALNAEVLAVVEAEDRIALQRFNDNYLVPLGVGFTYTMLIDGNDERGIDVGLYSKHPIRSIHSNVSLGLPGERTFSRDCAEFEIGNGRRRHALAAGEPLQEQGLRLRIGSSQVQAAIPSRRRGIVSNMTVLECDFVY